jgi:type IV pilus assembly protein PilO
MALQFPRMSAFKAIPANQKIAILGIVLAAIGGGYYFMFEDPQGQVFSNTLGQQSANLKTEIQKLDKEISTNKEKVKNLEELKKLTSELGLQLAKNQEHLPPESEATTVLKQLSDLGTRIGLTLKLWRPSPRQEDSSKLFVKLPADVEMVGGYHTLALFFDRISKLPRIINVSKIKMGAGAVEKDRVLVQAAFQLTAFAFPSAPVAPASPLVVAKPPGQ